MTTLSNFILTTGLIEPVDSIYQQEDLNQGMTLH